MIEINKKIWSFVVIIIVIFIAFFYFAQRNSFSTIKEAVEANSKIKISDYITIPINEKNYFILFNEDNYLVSAFLKKNTFGYKLIKIDKPKVDIQKENSENYSIFNAENKFSIAYGTSNSKQQVKVFNDDAISIPINLNFSAYATQEDIKIWYYSTDVEIDPSQVNISEKR